MPGRGNSRTYDKDKPNPLFVRVIQMLGNLARDERVRNAARECLDEANRKGIKNATRWAHEKVMEWINNGGLT